MSGHLPCPDCGSSDAMYDYGTHTHCFSCGRHRFADEPDAPEWSNAPRKPKMPKETKLYRGVFHDLVPRGIREETCRFFNYVCVDSGDLQAQVANYYKPGDTEPSAQKIRTPDKEFWVVGDLDRCGLFGENLWKSGGKRLVITEGELDALSYAQATGLSWPTVSVPSGAQGAAKAIRRSLEFVESFDEVVFLYDNDEPGRQAAVECAELLAPGKAKIARLPLKDASDMLKAGRTDELRKAVWNAKTFRPDGVVEGREIDLAELQQAVQRGYTLPYGALDAMVRGIRQRELWMICAGSGIGKSTLAREIGFSLLTKHHKKVGWVMLEESLTKTAQSLVAMYSNIPVGDLMENPGVVGQEVWDEARSCLLDHSAFYDAWGSTEIDNLIAKMRYLAVGCECDFIVLDHVSMVVSGLETDNERKSLDVLMTKLRQFVEQTGVGVVAVSHVRRNVGKTSFNEGGQISLTDLRGSAAIEQLSDIVIAAERDQQSSESSNVAQLRVLKNRPYGVLGAAGYAQYDQKTGRLVHYETDFTDEGEPETDLEF